MCSLLQIHHRLGPSYLLKSFSSFSSINVLFSTSSSPSPNSSISSAYSPSSHNTTSSVSSNPTFWDTRLQLWEDELSRQNKQNAQREKTTIHIEIKGRIYDGVAHVTSPTKIADGKFMGDALVALIDGHTLWDLNMPLSYSCKLEYLNFSHPHGEATLWHSASHVLAQALEYYYWPRHVLLRDGPALSRDGFFYDMHIMSEDGKLTSPMLGGELEAITKLGNDIARSKQPFQCMTVTKEFAKIMFNYNFLKLHIIDTINSPTVRLYRSGPFIDVCHGPHIPHTGRIKAFSILQTSHAMRTGSEHPLHRVNGIAFPTKKLMKEWKSHKEAMENRNHRTIGKKQQLFMFHSHSPGSAFFLPHGTRIYNALISFLRNQYREHGYDEVRTPLLYHKDLWEKSGHWDHYQEHMFMVHPGHQCDHSDLQETGLKPMNCPGHCLIFASQTRSYRDLPIRYADFSSLHRNEPSGTLTGLTRVRKFSQDDGHIFCTPSQVRDELISVLNFVQYVYSTFDFKFQLSLATRPKKYAGDLAMWNDAEEVLKEILIQFNKPWTIKEEDGAFYGPKVDISVVDAMGRHHQCATIQLDFQLPRRFNLNYKGEDGQQHVPILIHRAVFGSMERMIAMLTEHTAGKWPLWLSPRQVMVCPIVNRHQYFAHAVQNTIQKAGYYCDIGQANISLKKQIRTAQLMAYNYILVIGDQETKNKTVNVRTRDGVVHGTQTLSDFIQSLKTEIENKKKQ